MRSTGGSNPGSLSRSKFKNGPLEGQGNKNSGEACQGASGNSGEACQGKSGHGAASCKKSNTDHMACWSDRNSQRKPFKKEESAAGKQRSRMPQEQKENI